MPGTFSYAAATNTVTVTGGTSGSPADFASFVTADRAGTGTSLLAAWTPNSNTRALTYQVRPVELLALLISFTVAGKTTETDYIFITGTDWLGAGQTESINVSAGIGTYVTTKYFRTITNIDCSDNAAGGGTVWANGTVAVTQPIWGVIWKLVVGRAYCLDCYFKIGDATTATYFLDSGKNIYSSVTSANFSIKNNATFQLGVVVDATDKTTKQGCYVCFNNADMQAPMDCGAGTTAILLLYGGLFEGTGLRGYLGNTNNDSCRIWNVQFSKGITLNSTTKGDFFNIQLQGGYLGFNNPYGGSIYNQIKMTDYSSRAITFPASNSTVRNLTIINVTTEFGIGYAGAGVYHGINCICAFTFGMSAGWTGKFYRDYEIDLHLVDPAGANVASATVDLKDNTGMSAAGFPLTTGADGKIAMQTVSRGYYNYANGNTLQDYGPHTLTITKAGYQAYQDVITIDRKMDLEVALLAPAGGVSPTSLGLVPLGVKQVAI